jgi:uncharacterized protein (DUF1778 family)
MNAEANIHLRARVYERDLIDRAAKAVGQNRSQFMMSVLLKEASNILFDQSTVFLSDKHYDEFTNALDHPPAPNEALKKLLATKAPWEQKAGSHS